MLRLRRYRLFLFVAAFSAALLYYVVNVRHASLADVNRFRHFDFSHPHSKEPLAETQSRPPPSEYQREPDSGPIKFPPPDPEIRLPVVATTTTKRLAQTTTKDLTDNRRTTTSTALKEVETITGEDLLPKKYGGKKDDELEVINDGAREAERVPDDGPQATWLPQKEHNPIPNTKLIKLPSERSKALPKIQHDFPPESNADKSDRLRKLVAIRKAFEHAWEGYKRFAMPHDELLSVSKSYGDSFMGWGATLIDSLDSLWIMDLKDDFELAVKETAKISFKTSHKKEIPLFETVIRILGGLISAYDLSQEQYPVLLEKAVELADIVMGAFDTPNRMPDMYYKWAPSYASQYHRAGTHVVVAELGSLSLEFTRLAQITKEDKYYDAIARVQNALENWQMKTDIPGLWPLVLDASGCKKVDKVKVQSEDGDSEKPILLDSGHFSEEELVTGETPANLNKVEAGARNIHSRRQIGDSDENDTTKHTEEEDSRKTPDTPPINAIKTTGIGHDDQFCKKQGLNYEPYAKVHRYAIGGQADSTYEYLPKMHRLLGGISSQYESMYKSAASAIRDTILYRPMIKDEQRKLLFPALVEIDLGKKVKSKRTRTKWEATHLGCFAGGMFGLAAKTFAIPADMEIARQLTDGCIWAYESTPTKIMPEKFALTPCENAESCPWDEATWHKALDPNLKGRMDAVDAWNKEQKKLYEQAGLHVAKNHEHMDVAAKPQPTVYKGGIAKGDESRTSNAINKRDPPVIKGPTKASDHVYEENHAPAGDAPVGQVGFVAKVAMSHVRYVQARIQEERLPLSYTKIHDRKYILRPEAIESVFLMWRMTGEDYWRQKGWAMFQAIQEATHTEAGNAELEDVTSVLGEKKDKMESFWLAETLKYFYLLFSEPDLVNLDDYVLNTEAHPFKVPRS